ncbi:MAG: hypothetical protein JSV71_02235 [Nitrospiraceae bacterium]|nr:MAG: hypothetical protein JSV71_02235 [Nitrospiraceae bacterium]
MTIVREKTKTGFLAEQIKKIKANKKYQKMKTLSHKFYILNLTFSLGGIHGEL